MEAVGGKTIEREGHLPAVLWYGPQKSEDVVWLMNEYYAWA